MTLAELADGWESQQLLGSISVLKKKKVPACELSHCVEMSSWHVSQVSFGPVNLKGSIILLNFNVSAFLDQPLHTSPPNIHT